MKTTKVIIGLMAAWIVANAATIEPAHAGMTNTNTQEKPTEQKLEVKIDEVRQLVFRVLMNNPSRQKVQILIKDADNNILHEQTPGNDERYIRRFNLSTLADGTYTFEIGSGKDKYTQSFQILTQTNRLALAKK